MQAKIISKYSESDNYICYMAKLKHSRYFSDKVILYLPKEKGYLNNKSIISFHSKISKNEFYNNYNEFNYTLYLNSNNIVGNIFVNEYNLIENGNDKRSYKEEYFEYLDSNLSFKISNLIKAIVFGYKAEIDDELKEEFNKIGFSYILVVSGTAIYFLRLLINNLLKSKNNIIELIIVSSYVIFCNLNISLIRAYIMYLENFIKKKLKLNINLYIIIFSSILFFILYNPYIIYNYSFWYTYLAVFAINILYPKINSKLYVSLLYIFKVKHEKYVSKKRIFYILKYLFNNIALTFSIQIMLFPISLYTGNSIFILSFFSNTIMNVFIVFEYILGFISILFFKLPIVSNFMVYLLKLITIIIINITKMFNKLDMFSINFNKISFISMICMYILILSYNYGYILKFKLKYKLKNIYVIYYLIIILLVIIILVDFFVIYCLDFVYFFYVGQGNMAITKCDNVIIVSDIGSLSTDVKYIFLNFLKAYNIKNIDYVFLSHMHSDHVSGLLNLKEEIEEKQITIKNICGTYINNEIKEFCREHDINIIQLQKGDEIFINKKIKIDIFSPSVKNYIYSSDEENSNSMVYSISINNKNFLYMGDATIETEKEILKNNYVNNYYCIQVAHHGSKTSTSEEFLNVFKFKYAIISSEKSMYGHPNEEVMYRLKMYDIKNIILEYVGGIRFYI